MKKELEKEHEKELHAIRVSNTVHAQALMFCPVLSYALSSKHMFVIVHI